MVPRRARHLSLHPALPLRRPADRPPAPLDSDAISDAARSFVADALADASQAVVLVALEWCEFCWAIRKLFQRCNIPYRSVDIDSAALQADNWGGQIRAALAERTSMRSIPQTFVAGQLIGGATDVFAAFAEGRLQSLLTAHNIPFDDTLGADAPSLLPGWLQRP